MTKDEYMEKLANEVLERDGCGYSMLRCGFYVLLLVLLLSSCATQTRIEYRDRDVDHYITNTVHDTLRIKEKDSTYHQIVVRNDTVFDTKYIERTKWRDRIVERHDTVTKDSVVTEYEERVAEVVKYPKTYWWLLGISIISIMIGFIKFAKWLKIV